MFIVEPFTPSWRPAFVESRNALFTPVSEDYCRRVETADPAFPVNTYICREDERVVSWASFYTRRIRLGASSSDALRLGQACAIGTLPEYRRKGLGKKVWQAAEKDLSARADGILVYTDESGVGYGFYRSLGYLPLAYPACFRLVPSASGAGSAAALAEAVATHGCRLRSAPLTEVISSASAEIGRVFSACHPGHVGHLADRPQALDTWSRVSFFYESEFMGFAPRISWLERPDGSWSAYAIWAGPMDRVAWKKGAVEIWEIACEDDCDPGCLRALLAPVIASARSGSPVDWWAIPGHFLSGWMPGLGFEELPRGLCVLGKLFSPAKILAGRLESELPETRVLECVEGPGERVDLRLEGATAHLERDAALRLLLGRTTAAAEHLHGLLSVRPSSRTSSVHALLDRACPAAPWAYFASEFI